MADTQILRSFMENVKQAAGDNPGSELVLQLSPECLKEFWSLSETDWERERWTLVDENLPALRGTAEEFRQRLKKELAGHVVEIKVSDEFDGLKVVPI